eukprot:g2972.t1
MFDVARVLSRFMPLLMLCVTIEHADAVFDEGTSWQDEVYRVLEEGIAESAFPGAVAAITIDRTTTFFEAGTFTYEESSEPMSVNDTLFDLASLTKVTATTTATMLLFQRGILAIEDNVADLFPEAFSAADERKSRIEILHLLTHTAGFPPDPTPDDLRSDCLAAAQIERVANKIDPIDQCYFEAFARLNIFEPVAKASLSNAFFGFRPDQFATRCAPTWNDTKADFPGECVLPFRERVLQGEVSDGNAYALGGVAGHAGVFAGVRELVDFLGMILYASSDSVLGITKETAHLFTTVWNASQSSRALGWDTNDYATNTYRGCGNLSSQTFTHTGYTGTQLCADPANNVMTVLLTNRVYPRADDESKTKIHTIRMKLNNVVADMLHDREGTGDRAWMRD